MDGLYASRKVWIVSTWMACITAIKNATKIKSQNWNCLFMEGVILTDLSHYLYLAKSRPTAHFRSKLDCTFLRYKARRRSWTWKIYLKSRKNPKSTNCALFCEPVILGKSLLISPHTCKEDGIRVKEGQNSTLSLKEWSKTRALRFWKPKKNYKYDRLIVLPSGYPLVLDCHSSFFLTGTSQYL